EVFRGTSALVQLFWFYFALPFLGLRLNALTAGILVLGLNAGAYGSEVVRSAIRNVGVGQHEAALALNLTRRQKMIHIVFPQATLAMIPPAGNLLIELLKNTSLVSLITLSELTFQAETLRDATLQTTKIFSIVLLIYFLLAQGLSRLMRMLEKRLARGMDHGGLR
ncbi:MAG: ectoine/hydroxyectoine ABC transporter permease subunit EhuC, partial [bacterium]